MRIEGGTKILETQEDILEFLVSPPESGAVFFEAAIIDWTMYPVKRIKRDVSLEMLATPLSLTDFTK